MTIWVAEWIIKIGVDQILFVEYYYEDKTASHVTCIYTDETRNFPEAFLSINWKLVEHLVKRIT